MSEGRRSVGQVANEVRLRIGAHNTVVIGAGIAFYALLALVPTLIALISVYSLVTDPAEIAEQIRDVTKDLDPATADVVTEQVETAAEEARGASGWTGLLIGIGLALFAASGAVQKLMGAVSMAYDTHESRPGILVRALAYVFTAGAIVGVALLAFTLGALPAIIDSLDVSGIADTAVTVARIPLAALAMLFGLTVLYRYGPDRSPRTPWKNPGALVGTILFMVFAFLFSLYFRFVGSMPASYGILGSVAALIIFLQLTAISVIIGAEVNAVVETDRAAARAERESQPAPVRPVEPIPLGQALVGLVALVALGRKRD